MKKFFCFILSIIIFTNFSAVTVFAVDLDEQDTLFKDWEIVEDDESDLDIIKKNIPAYIQFLLAQTGVTFCDHDFSRVWDDTEKWFDEHRTKMVVVKNKKTGEKGVRVKKSVTDELLNNLKESNKQPENGGYELVKTVPLSQVSTMYFDSTAEYKTLLNLLNDNDGYVGFTRYSGYKSSFFKVNVNEYWIKKGATSKFNNGDSIKELSSFYSVKTANSGSTGYRYIALQSDTPIQNWEDEDNMYNFRNDRVYDFYGLELFDFFRNASGESYYRNPFQRGNFIISKSGTSIPVFNSLNDAIRYMVDHNLYYTGSNYTGEGKEIIVSFDEIDKILNGYYSGMYDMLQRLIEQQGNGLTPEQLQQLVDEVQTSFGMLKDTINAGFEQQDILIQKNSQIMQNIADALNAFFSQTKEFRSTFLKSFSEYEKGEKERDEMLYSLLSDYIESKKDSPDNGDTQESSGTWDKFVDNVYQFFSDLMNKLDEIFYSPDGENFLGLIHEDIAILTEQFEDFASDCTGYMEDMIAAIKNIKIRSPVRPSVSGGGNGNDAIWDFLDFITDKGELALDKVEEETGNTISALSDVFGTVADILTEKFPFSIPWDLLAIITALAAEPEPPHFEIPIVLEHYGINEKFVIDFTDYGYLSDISRTFLSVIWVVYLMNFTVKFTDTKRK